MKDEKIIELFFARDEEAIRETQNKYGNLCLYIAANFLALREDREECVNDTLLELWQSIPPEKPIDLRAYVATIVRSRAIDKSRANNAWKRGGNVQIVGEEFLSMLDDGCDLAEDYESVRAGRVINDYLGALPKPERAVFIMRYWLDESITNISARTGFSEGRIKMMLMRTRKKLEERLRLEGITV
ncbi:MAG: sigma-70 family RNA polymerase sigma factor [Clostridia bacterium]|nr:sigma-70 family RNA polymerase sigma factor [Clostridia bacterium]